MFPVLSLFPLPARELTLGPWLGLVALLLAMLGWTLRARVARRTVSAAAALFLLSACFAWQRKLAIGPISLQSYGACLALAVSVGFLLFRRAAERAALESEHSHEFALAAISAGLIASHAGYALLSGAGSPPWLALLAVTRGGAILNVGLIAGALAGYAYARVKNLSWFELADAAVLPLCLALAIGRIGSYLAGTEHGRRLADGSPRWLQRLGTFPHWASEHGMGSPAWLEQVEFAGLAPESSVAFAVHPTQLYEVLALLLLFTLLQELAKRRAFSGQLTLTFALAYGVLRLVLDAFRSEYSVELLGPALVSTRRISLSQWLALGFVLSALALWRRTSRRRTGAEASAVTDVT